MKLIALDLDGTLLDRRSHLSEENIVAVGRAQAAGLEVVLVTGRSWRSTRTYYEALGLSGPSICYLGALTVANGTGRVIQHQPLARTAWEPVRDLASAKGLALTICIATDQADHTHTVLANDVAYAACRAIDFTDWEGWNPYTEQIPDLSHCKALPTLAAVYGDRSVHLVREAFPQGLPYSQFDLTDRIPGETVLHIWHHTVNKGQALAAYCADRGILPHEVMAIGDAPMDLEMIRYAGVGVAVPHGDPLLIAAADWVVSPAEAIYRILKGDRP